MTENSTPVETTEATEPEAELFWQVTARAHESGHGSTILIEMRDAFGSDLPENLRTYSLGKALRTAADSVIDSVIESAVAFNGDNE